MPPESFQPKVHTKWNQDLRNKGEINNKTQQNEPDKVFVFGYIHLLNHNSKCSKYINVSRDECCVRSCQQGLHLLLVQSNFGARLSSNSRPICLLWGSNMLNLVFPLLGIYAVSPLCLNVDNFIWLVEIIDADDLCRCCKYFSNS